LKSKLAGEKMLNQLPVAKKGLMEIILKVLGRLEETETIEGSLRKILAQVEVLFRRNLWAEAQRRILKGMQLAKDHDKQSLSLELLKWKIKLHKKTGQATDFGQMHIWLKEEDHILQQLHDEAQLRRAHDEFFTFLSRGGSASSLLSQFSPNEVLQREIFKKPVHQLHFNAQIIWHYVHVYAHQYKGDWAGIRKHFALMLELWEANPHRQQQELDRYLITLISYLDASKDSLSTTELYQRIDQMRGIQQKSRTMAAKVFHYTYHLELTHAIHTGQMPQSPDFESKIQAGISEFGGLMDAPAQMSFYSNLAILYFFHQNPSRSLYWLNQIIQGRENKLREDIRQFTKCLQLANQFELGNYDVVNYGAEAMRKSQSRREQEIPLQILVAKYLLQLLQQPKPAQAPIWQAFQKELEQLQEAKREIAGIEPFIIWTRSHATEKTMLQCIAKPF
jgi:hypothetical protein